MGPDQVKISLEHKGQQHAMRERALKRQAEKEAEEAELRREQFARAQEKLLVLEQRAKERRMKDKQEEKERWRQEVEERRRQESPHLRGWPVDHASSQSRAVAANANSQGGGPASLHSRGWFIGSTTSSPALTELPAETPPPPPKILIRPHEHGKAANVAHMVDGGNQGEQHRHESHEAHRGSGHAGEAASVSVKPPELLPVHRSAQHEHRGSGRSNSGGSSSRGQDRNPVQEAIGGDAKSGADYYHQHQRDNSKHRCKEKQQRQRQMLTEEAEDTSAAEPPTGGSWSAANYDAQQQQQAWSSPPQTWKNSGHMDEKAWQQDGWEKHSTAENEQEVHKRSEWCQWSRGGNWQQHGAEPDVQQHWEWSGFDWAHEKQAQGRTYYGTQGSSDYYKSRIPHEMRVNGQGNGSVWHGNTWQDSNYDHGTQAARPRISVGGLDEDVAAAPAAVAAGAAAQTAASRSRIRAAAREARASLAAGAARGRQTAGDNARMREDPQAVEIGSHRGLRAFSDDEVLPLGINPIGVAPAAAENRSRCRLRAFSDDETSINHIHRGLRAFSGACSSDEEEDVVGPSRAWRRAVDTPHRGIAEGLPPQDLRGTACRSHRGLRAFSRGASSSSDGEDQPRGFAAASGGHAVNRDTAKLRAWVSGSRTPPMPSGSQKPPLSSGSQTTPMSPTCRGNTAKAKEGRDFAAKLFRSVIHPKAAVAVGQQRQQLLHCGGIAAIPKPTAEAPTEDVGGTSDPLTVADSKAAAPSSRQSHAPGEQRNSAEPGRVEDGCNLVVRTSDDSAESNGFDVTEKAAEGNNIAGAARSYYGRRDAAMVGGVAISWLASVSRRTPQCSQPQTQQPLKQEQQQMSSLEQLEEAAEVAQDALSTPDPCIEGSE